MAFVFLYPFCADGLARAQASISEADVVEVLSGEKQSAPGAKTEKGSVLPSHRVSVFVQFKAGRAEILKDSHAMLGAIGKSLASEALKHMDFMIIVYAEISGTKQAALNLALKRALSVKKMMTVSFSVSAKRLKVKGLLDMKHDSGRTPNAPKIEHTRAGRVDFIAIEQ